MIALALQKLEGLGVAETFKLLKVSATPPAASHAAVASAHAKHAFAAATKAAPRVSVACFASAATATQTPIGVAAASFGDGDAETFPGFRVLREVSQSKARVAHGLADDGAA